MTLPVSKYEELLETVRSLKHQTIRVRELASPLLDTIINANTNTWVSEQDAEVKGMEPRLAGSQHSEPGSSGAATWPHDRTMWHSEPSAASRSPPDAGSVMSFASSSGAAPLDLVLGSAERERLDAKADVVYGLLAALGGGDAPDMSDTLLALSASPDGGRAMRQAGCVPALVQLLHARDTGDASKAGRALRNLVLAHPDDRLRKRELKVLRLLEDVRVHCSTTPNTTTNGVHEESERTAVATAATITTAEDEEEEFAHPTVAMEQLIKLSFDEGYRQSICDLGGIQTLARLLEAEHARHGASATAPGCIALRRYAGMALTNLTFGHGRNKALLCAQPGFLCCLVSQLDASSDELRQVAASVLRNLSWRADAASRAALRRAAVVPALANAAMKTRREPALRALLSALWNLSAHCSTNKAELCSVPGALAFLVDMLAWRAPSRTLVIAENAGGVLRNVSSHVAMRDDYRAILRARGALPLLLQQLRSPSLTVVANACGTLWNLSAKCERDQRMLWELGAAPMLRSLNHSKHTLIATGSRAALKNLLAARPAATPLTPLDSTARALGLPALPTLGARRQRALAHDLAHPHLAETCDNVEPPAASDYAETDLDTPTDYSLRYAEDDSDKDEPGADTVRTYCTEGTPYETPRNFSTATSMSDLRCVDSNAAKAPGGAPTSTGSNEKELEPEPEPETPEKPVKYCEEGTPRCCSPPAPATASAAAKETPLMFSRCSSLGSLSSAEQHSIHDDRSSIVSDLSRLTSGVVSPSELPDSPTQTVPPSPRQRQRQVMPPQAPTPAQRSVFDDNVIKFKEVNTPAEFSAATSLSALTIDDDLPLVLTSPAQAPQEPQPKPEAPSSPPTSAPLSSAAVASTVDNEEDADADPDADEQAEDDMLAACINIGMQNNRLRPAPVTERAASPAVHSNLSDSSNASAEHEDMLAECIQAAMPKTRPKPTRILRQRLFKTTATFVPAAAFDELERYAVEDSPCQFSLRSSLSDLTLDSAVSASSAANATAVSAANVTATTVSSGGRLSRADSLSSLSDTEQALLEQCIQAGMPKSKVQSSVTLPEPAPPIQPKNAPAASAAAGQTPSSGIAITAAPTAPDNNINETGTDTALNTTTTSNNMNFGFDSNLLTENNIKPSADTVDKLLDLDGSVEENNSSSDSEQNRSNSRMLDPDAMIASLDRFTAELVSQVSHLPHHDCKLDNTWAEDTSPNDVSCPSISVSAPLPLALTTSFPSECEDGNNAPSQATSPLTESTLIALEAAKLAHDMQCSVELEHTQPPSVMDSLVSLTSSCTSDAAVQLPTLSASARNSPVAGRKRSLPAGLLVRRALSYSASNLDHVQPPSVMAGDFLDLVDLENSMISVASITSEVAVEPIAVTTTIASTDGDVWQDCVTQPNDTITEWSDAVSVTPIASDTAPEDSSAESTPRRRRPTPRERRQMAQERYRTYTVITTTTATTNAIITTSSSIINNLDNSNSLDVTITSGSSGSPSNVTNKLTPRERRQLDRSRFQTRVLNGECKLTPLQRRRDNAERYRTRTISCDDEDLHTVLAQQAGIVLDTLRADELLDCETLSLVSNEDDSEVHNSINVSNYRTYHKSWSFNKKLPVVEQNEITEDPSLSPPDSTNTTTKITKPKIVKPDEKPSTVVTAQPEEEEIKAVRGRRKPLYSSSATKSIFRPLKNAANSIKNATKLPTSNNNNNTSNSKSNQNISAGSSIKKKSFAAPVKPPAKKATSVNIKRRPASASAATPAPQPLERQGTFTKDEVKKSRIPTVGTRARSTQPVQNQTVSSTQQKPTSANRSPPVRSLSHVERRPSGTTTATSRIAGIWKRSNTTANTVRVRNPKPATSTATTSSVPTPAKRLSRLSSFVPAEQISVT